MLTAPEFTIVRNWIVSKRDRDNKNWDEIRNYKDTEERLQEFLNLQHEDNDWPEMTIQEWQELVELMRLAEEEANRNAQDRGAATMNNPNENEYNGVHIPADPRSSWQNYKRKLLLKYSENDVEAIERDSFQILRNLSANTVENGPKKGLVIGNVQSGKTGNMAALMAMAADLGWNMFIVLSGIIENLRIQTLNRLTEDLNASHATCNISWEGLLKTELNLPAGHMPCDKHFERGSQTRYLTVCLKNYRRLQNLIEWLQSDAATQEQMKVLVIDDEADQASINTGNPNNRTRINALIVNLVNGKKTNGSDSEGHFCAMNYIGYTATPYANVLNEGTEASLYPKDFISTLQVPNIYMGPQQIFGISSDGNNYEGMNIVRKVNNNDINVLKELHDNYATPLPESLIDAICWFYCGVATMRYWQINKPFTLLVHTSQLTSHHHNVSSAIRSYINSVNINEFLARCNNIWDRETAEFTLDSFCNSYPNYSIPRDEIKDYPDFNQIMPNIVELLQGQRICSIYINEEGNIEYTRKVHLCIDNSAEQNEEDEIIRLLYPKQPLDYASAFIVVGGATLSRGLTIEGLISTYFMRTVKAADTLMQMGRWFGYRREYELIPRIWMTERTESQFKFLSLLDQNLRDEIHMMAMQGLSPAHYGPRVTNSPLYSLIQITANNRMQQAVLGDWNFSGTNIQTHLFDNNTNILRDNLNLATNFLSNLGNPTRSNTNQNDLVWFDVESETIINFLLNYQFQERLKVFADMTPFTEWIRQITETGTYGTWNVILAGTANNARFTIADTSVGKTNRTWKAIERERNPNIINIGVLRDPRNLLSDIDWDTASDNVRNRIEHFSSRYVNEIRSEANLDFHPQLIVYIIDKESRPQQRYEGDRCALNTAVDIAGICINIPSRSSENVNANHATTLHINMPEQMEELDIEAEE